MSKGFTTRRHEVNGHPLKYYAIVHQTLAILNDLTDDQLNTLITLDDEYFTKTRFKECLLNTYGWETLFNKLIEDGWIEQWREWEPHKRQAALFKPTGKSHQLISRIYRILVGKEELPTTVKRNKLMKQDQNLSYLEKLLKKQINRMVDDRKNSNRKAWED